MVTLELTADDAALLAKVLDYYVSELRMEIGGTDRKTMRDDLKEQEVRLKTIAQSLKGPS